MLPSLLNSKILSLTNVVKISSICSVSANVPSVPLICSRLWDYLPQSPPKGKPQPPANILSQPPAYIPAHIQSNISQQHHIFLNLKSLSLPQLTALHELVDNHVFLTSVLCKWHSDPNFWGEME